MRRQVSTAFYRYWRGAALVGGGLSMTAGLCLVVALFSCTSARQRGAASVGAFIDCQQPNIAKALPDLVELGKTALLSRISGDGHADASAIKADMASAKSDLAKCVIAAAIAALATPVEQAPGAPAAAGLVVDGVALRAAFASGRQSLGWAPVHVGSEVL